MNQFMNWLKKLASGYIHGIDELVFEDCKPQFMKMVQSNFQ